MKSTLFFSLLNLLRLCFWSVGVGLVFCLFVFFIFKQYSLNLLNPKKSLATICLEIEVRCQLSPELIFAGSLPSQVFVVFATLHHFTLFGQKSHLLDN